MYMQQVEDIKTTRMAAGATGDTVEALVQSLADMVGTGTDIDVAALETALREAGGEGADITALVNDIVARLKEEQDARDKADEEEMMATAMKLHMGISAPTATDTGNAGNRYAAYSADDSEIVVAIDDAADVSLSEDKKTMVAALSLSSDCTPFEPPYPPVHRGRRPRSPPAPGLRRRSHRPPVPPGPWSVDVPKACVAVI